MSFVSKKSLKQQIDNLQEEVKRLKKIVIDDELKHLRRVNQEYETQNEMLSHIRFELKEARIVENQETGSISVRVVYNPISFVIPIDDEGVPQKNDFFRAINGLMLSSVEDLSKLSKLFEKAKKMATDKNNY